MSHFTPNPALDLVLERTIPMPPERVWAGTWASPKRWGAALDQLVVTLMTISHNA